MLANGFLTVLDLIREDFERSPEGLKSTDFDQKAWAIAHGFEEGGFRKVQEIVPKSLKRLLRACKWISKCFGAYS